jgi:hypothetical protein
MKAITRATFVLMTIVLLNSCGFGSDDDCSLFSDNCSTGNNHVSLDCHNLDPDKVYAYGTLQEGLVGREALFDPLDPTSFCVGFGGAFFEGVITADGRYIFENDLNFYRLGQDELIKNQITSTSSSEAIWTYPGNALDNDTLLHTSTASACGVRLVMLNPSNDALFYSCPNNTIHTETASPYYSLGNDELLAITPDGSMVVGSYNGVRLVADDLTETALTIPSTAAFSILKFLTAKLYVNPTTTNNSLWIALEGFNDSSQRRWSVDLVTMTVTDQGPFTELPADTSSSYSYKMDGNGNLWHIGSDTTGSFVDVIIQRPLVSDGQLSTVVYSEADLITTKNWAYEDIPEVRLHASYLATGS